MAFLLGVFLLLLLVSFLLRRPSFFKSLHQKHVLITGGSSGIGLATAEKCLAEGAFVTLVARNEANLEKARDYLVQATACKAEQIFLKAADVSNATAITQAVQDAFRWRAIDILICNAGTAKAGLFEELTAEELEMVTRVNVMGSVYPVHAVIPLMKQRSLTNPSAIVFMSSLSAFLFVYGVNIYSATKLAQKGLAEMLRLELMQYNIRVSLVCPGFTETPLLNEADNLVFISESGKKVWMYVRKYAFSARAVANATMEGVKRGEFLITMGLHGFLIATLTRGFVPDDSIQRAILEFIVLLPMRAFSFVLQALTTNLLQQPLPPIHKRP